MRPLLASLALLLLALCRQSAGVSWSVKTVNSQTSSNSVSFISNDKKEKVKSGVTKQAKKTSHGSEPTEEQMKQVFELLGNTIFIAALQAAGGTLERLPELEKALANGVLCELEEPGLIKKLNKISYGIDSDDLDAASKEKEKAEAATQGFDCLKAAPTGQSNEQTEGFKNTHNCWCNDKKSFLYCFFKAALIDLKKNHKEAKKTCRPQAVETLKNSGNKMLGELFTEANFGDDKFDKAFDGDVEFFTTDAMKKLLCDAIDPTVEAAVKAVYAADGLYWLTETVLYSIIFGEPAESLSETCKSGDFDSEFGKCVCKQDTGYTFCIYKVIAKAFSDAGYLTCGAAPAFVADKKPAALPHLAHKGSSKSSSSATTTFSLLAPTAAAAALLLRQ